MLIAWVPADKISKVRQGYKFKKTGSDKVSRFSVVHAHKPLSDVGVKAGMTVSVKDVGPQFSYRGVSSWLVCSLVAGAGVVLTLVCAGQVFFFEYFGPVVIMLLFSTRPAFIYGEQAKTLPYTFPATYDASLCVSKCLRWRR